MKTVLLTGAAGRIGRWLRSALGDKYQLRCLDRVAIDDDVDAIQADILDFPALLDAMQGADAVVHLAARAELEQPWHDALETGISGTYNVLEAARQAGVKRVIYASSSAVLGMLEMKTGQRVSPDMPVHPTTPYGIGKAAGEMLCRYYAETHGLSVICLRIGFFQIDPPIPQSTGDDLLRAWCSPADLAQIVEKSLEAGAIDFEIFYAVSNNTRVLWDTTNARKRLGYRPKDNPEDLVRERHAGPEGALTQQHRLLARAAVMPAEDALKSWQRWQQLVDLEQDHLDTVTYRLLPLIYYNLSMQKVDDRWMTKLKGVYRRAWLENQLLLQRTVQFVQQIQARGIHVMLLDDLASILCLYDGQGARRPYSLDMLVHHKDLAELIELCHEWQVWPKVRHPERYLSVETPLELWPPFETPITMAWRILPAIRTEGDSEASWKAARTAHTGELDVAVPDLETHYLRACWRAAQVRLDVRPFVLIDLLWMLHKRADEIDVQRIADLARRNQCVLLARRITELLVAIAPAPKAEQLHERLLKERASWWERLEAGALYGYSIAPRLGIRILRRLLLYRRSPKQGGLLGPFRYIQYVWGADGLRALPGHAFRYLADVAASTRAT